MWSRACFIGSAVTLGYALQIRDGFYDDTALVWLTAALALSFAGVSMLGKIGPTWRNEERIVAGIAALAIAVQVACLLRGSPGMYLPERTNLGLFRAGVAVEAALVLVGVSGIRKLAGVWFPALLAVHLALGVWILRESPSPRIDVVVVHREAIDALDRGQSPYAITFDNIYGTNSGFYNPRAIAGHRVMFGYPYPPLSLILAAPGHWLTGDYRYAELAAWILGAALIGFAQQGTAARLIAALFLTQPRGFFVLEQGWTEPIAVLTLAFTTFALIRRPGLAAWAAGLLIVTKQYLALAVPIVARIAMSRRDVFAFLLRALAVAAIVTVPFVIWSPRAFFESVVFLQMREPFRTDSLSYLSWASRHGLGAGSFLWAIGAAALTVAASMVVTPNTPAGFAASIALSAFMTFAFGSKAFCNYYFFVVGAMCCAVAAQSSRARP
jgi:hypothetical protein